MSKQFDVIVIGGGPAGINAAIELGTLGIKTLVVDDKNAGAHFAALRGAATVVGPFDEPPVERGAAAGRGPGATASAGPSQPPANPTAPSAKHRKFAWRSRALRRRSTSRSRSA